MKCHFRKQIEHIKDTPEKSEDAQGSKQQGRITMPMNLVKFRKTNPFSE